MRTLDQMIASEVLCCMSSLVSTLANGTALTFSDRAAMRSSAGAELMDLAQQAFELAAPVDDWESAAAEAGCSVEPHKDGFRYHFEGDDDDDPMVYPTEAEAWAAACRVDNIDPYESEVYEHWAVTDWFADKLEAAGEKVDRDFAGIAVWARTTTGQSIAMDGVIQRVYAETHTA